MAWVALWVTAWAAAATVAGATSKQGFLHLAMQDPPLCTLSAQANFSNAVKVYANRFDNSRMLAFEGDGLAAETNVQCKGAMPDSCSSTKTKLDQSCDDVICPCEPVVNLNFGYMKRMVKTLLPMCLDTPAEGEKRRFRVLLIGLGGGALPEYILAKCPDGTEVESVEYDPRVIDVATRFFGLNPKPVTNRIEQGEGGEAVRTRAMRSEQYDVVLVDAFESARVPASCRSKEFIENLRWILRPGGVVMQNILSADHRMTLPIYRQIFGAESVNTEDFDAGFAHLIRAELPFPL